MKTTRLVLLSVVVLAATALAVDPPPDGGYSSQNTAEGEDALFSLTTGVGNTALGFNALYSNTQGDYNTAIGVYALRENTIGISNTATGQDALGSNTTGSDNTAIGLQALIFNTSGSGNTGAGVNVLYKNVDGSNNTATGEWALFGNQSGNSNTATGVNALLNNSDGSSNTADGVNALLNNFGSFNTATGRGALYKNTLGDTNTAVGYQALMNNNSGNNNTALGASAGSNLTTGSNNVYIAAFGATSESNTIRIGRAGLQTAVFVQGIWGATAAGGIPVMSDGFGHLGTQTSSARYKEAIKPMGDASDVLLSLQPVSFCYRKDLDPKAIPQFGLVAEQVEKIDPDLVARDEQGKPYTVRYEAVNAMLLNEFLKEHRKVEEQAQINQEQAATITDLKSAVAQQQKDIAALTASLNAQAAQIQKVSDQLATTVPTPRVVAEN